MAINPSTLYTGKIVAPSTEYPYGSAQDITVTGDGTGTPWIASQLNDIYGHHQALLKSAGIVPSGSPDEVGASQYLQSIVELASGRAFNYDDSGLADAYVLDVQTDQEGPSSYFTGMVAVFEAGNNNTGASTVNINGLGVKNIVDDITGNTLNSGRILNGLRSEIIYDGVSFRLTTKSEVLNSKTIDIGDWDMPTDLNIGVAHNLDFTKIRTVSVMIRNDAGTVQNMLTPGIFAVGEGVEGNMAGLSATLITLQRRTGGAYDNVNYDSIGYNRGWITIEYVG